MTNAELELLKANVDRQVEIDTRDGECLRIKVLFVFDRESDHNLLFDVISPENDRAAEGGPAPAYSLPLADILSVRSIPSE